MLNQIEREWFLNRGIESQPSLSTDELKRNYFLSLGISGARINELEKRWLKKIIVDNGGTPSGDYISGLLCQALATLGIQSTPFNSQNWVLLYQNYNP
jgi:hypothetical protein